MLEEKKNQIKAILATMFVMYDKKMPEEAMKMYTAKLMKFDLDDIKTAVNKLVETEEFYPKLATIVKYLTPSEGKLSLIAEDQFDNWVRVQQGFSSVNKTDRITDYLNKNYTYRFRDCTESGLTFLKKDFVKDYLAAYALGDELPDEGKMLSAPGIRDLASTLSAKRLDSAR